jgi:RNA polymerase sigma factor (sigma-70 family)
VDSAGAGEAQQARDGLPVPGGAGAPLGTRGQKKPEEVGATQPAMAPVWGWKEMDAPFTPSRAEALDAAYRRYRPFLLDKARLWFPSLRGMEQDLYQAAWESLLRNQDHVTSIESYLEHALYKRGLDIVRRRDRHEARWQDLTQVSMMTANAAAADRTSPSPDEQAEMRREAQELAELLDELTPLQQRIVKLRWGFGVERSEVGSLLGISERMVKRELEEVTPVVTRDLEFVRSGRWCERKRSMVVAYSLELLSAGRARRAERHIAECRGCQGVVLSLRAQLRNVAACIPLPVLFHASVDVPLTQAVDLGDAGHGALTHLLTSVKHHAMALFTRTPAGDLATSPVAAGGGLRGGGSAIAAVTACLVAGGGAYCAVDGVPEPVRDLAGIEQPQAKERDQTSAPDPAKEPIPPPASEQPQQPVNDTASKDTSTAPNKQEEVQETLPASPAPRGSKEFGAASASNPPLGPAPAPVTGGGEFTP